MILWLNFQGWLHQQPKCWQNFIAHIDSNFGKRAYIDRRELIMEELSLYGAEWVYIVENCKEYLEFKDEEHYTLFLLRWA